MPPSTPTPSALDNSRDHCLTVLICTHNRADLLDRVIASLNAARRPAWPVRILVAANACSDDTAARMQAYIARQPELGSLPLELLEVPTPGKSHALNAAIPTVDQGIIAFVDDDHRVHPDYLCSIVEAATLHPDTGLFCGRILPDWDGSEPPWVHDEGPYRIYPLPVPRYDQGSEPKSITPEEGPIPGGGNLVMRQWVFKICGEFSTELGPHGHDLGGGEDSEFVLRAMQRGVGCEYLPAMVQYHYVDLERLKLSYLLKKSYQRTRSTSRIHGNGKVPLYMWRKLAEYGFHSLFSLGWARRRFFWMRFAAALGEVKGRRESGHRGRGKPLAPDKTDWTLGAIGVLSVLSGMTALWLAGSAAWHALAPAFLVAAAGSGLLLTKSITGFSQTGPAIRDEILMHYRRYGLYALARLTLWAFLLQSFLAGAGVLTYASLISLTGARWSDGLATISALIGLGGLSALQFIRLLRINPGLLVASINYRMSRFHRLWRWASLERINQLTRIVAWIAGFILLAAALRLLADKQFSGFWLLMSATGFYAGTCFWAIWRPDPLGVVNAQSAPGKKPNIVMIGTDTLRADRLGSLGYQRALTPNIDELSKQATLFSNCYVPCARTAPSLVSMFTGTWPMTHGVRDNFVSDDETRLKADALPTVLRSNGYYTATLSDWCGADLAKFSFGFDLTDLPDDQWNLKYLMRQGPKDLRLFLHAFTHNRFGRVFLPELYYLGGVPLTTDMGRRGRRLLSKLADQNQPFLLNLFFSTTHPPFASEHPWYERYTNSTYNGSSRFAMARLTDPFEIIRRQGAPKEEFDLDQIIDLYDGCVAQFDDEVGKLLRHIDACGLTSNTIIVVYSDHGMEFFEHETWGQGNSALGDFSARVPLIIKTPGKPHPQEVNDVVRSIDIAPTLLDLAGIEHHGRMEGVSLKAALQGDPLPDLVAYNETGLWMTDMPGMHPEHLRYPSLLELIEIPDRESGTLAIKPDFTRQIIAAKDRMIRLGRWKLVMQPLKSGARYLLFDMVTDPACVHDLSAEEPGQVKHLQQLLERICAGDLHH